MQHNLFMGRTFLMQHNLYDKDLECGGAED